uniref:ZP domain-containing protein n=1 Tax=Syphacia muris TaxID=451379 RepID=A0A0N5ARK5_9BILA
MKLASALLTVKLIILQLPLFIRSIPIDNGVEGDPEIECGPTSITVNFNTQKAFEGHVYVKGLFSEQGCRNSETGRQVAGITLPFETCNVARTRSLNPKGIFVTTTVVISFHPHFVTKIDRAYRIQCFYTEADKTVSADVAVSDLTTAFHSQSVPMPICKYEILLNGPDGTPVSYAEIGQQVYHKWTCSSETTDTFCMVVHSCFVDDGNGDKVNIINDEGCALDRYVLNNLDYPSDLVAGQEAHIYKYADRSQLFYQCQITITIKEPNTECPRPKCPETSSRPGELAAVVTNPNAAVYKVQGYSDQSQPGPVNAVTKKPLTPPAQLALSRFVREVDWRNASAIGTMDVRTEISALDILESEARKHKQYRDLHAAELQRLDNVYCVNHDTAALIRLVVILMSSLIVLLAVYIIILRKARKCTKLQP